MNEIGSQILVGVIAGVVLMALGWTAHRVRRRWRHRRRPIDAPLKNGIQWRCERVIDGDDPRVSAACRIWRQAGIPAEQLISEQSLATWLEDSKRPIHTGPDGQARPIDFEDYLLVAVSGNNVGAALFGTYYRSLGRLFIAYLAHDKQFGVSPTAPVKRLYERLIADLKSGALAGCGSLVFEIEDPDELRAKEQAGVAFDRDRVGHAFARRRLFLHSLRRAGFSSGQLELPYLQPSLDLRCKPSRALALILAKRTAVDGQELESIPLSEARAVVEFVYERVYGDTVKDEPDAHGISPEYVAEYLAHLATLRETVFASAIIAELRRRDPLGSVMGDPVVPLTREFPNPYADHPDPKGR